MHVEQQHVQRKGRYSQRWEQWSLLLGTFSASFSARNSKFGYYQNPFKKNLLKIRNIMAVRSANDETQCVVGADGDAHLRYLLKTICCCISPRHCPLLIMSCARAPSFVPNAVILSLVWRQMDENTFPEIEHVDSPRVCLLCALVSVCACVCFFMCACLCVVGWGGDRWLQSGAPYLPKVHWM